jgi:MFS family permease
MQRSAWLILAALCLTRFALGFQFQTVGSTVPALRSAFAMDLAAIGTLIGLFKLPGLLLALPAGALGRRFGDKPVVLVGIALMALGGALSGASSSFALLAVGRLLSGFGAAVLFVLLTKMTTDWFAGRSVFLGMAIFIVGWPIGIAAGQAVQPAISDTISWAAVFELSAVLLAVAFAAMALIYRPPPAVGPAPARQGGFAPAEIWLICVAGAAWMLVNVNYLVLLSFGPTLLVEQGLDAVSAGRAVSMMSWAFLIGLPAGGLLATRFGLATPVMFGGLCATAAIALLLPILPWPAATYALYGLCYAGMAPVLGALPTHALRPENRAVGFGIYYCWYYAGTAGLPPVAGLLSDMYGRATAAVAFAAAMQFGVLLLVLLFRAEHRRVGLVPTPS